MCPCRDGVGSADPGGRRGRSGFTLIDVVVAVVVIAALVAILTPTFSRAQEAAHRVACASNQRQIGLGLQMFAYERNDRLPGSVFDADGDAMPPEGADAEEAVYLRVDEPWSERPMWDGLGHLVAEHYVVAQEAYYCPSHTGRFTFDAYSEARSSGRGEIVSNFHYRVDDGTRPARFSRLGPGYSLVADSMRSEEEFSHRVGLNVLTADLSASWVADTNGELLERVSSPFGWVDPVRLRPTDLWPEVEQLRASAANP